MKTAYVCQEMYFSEVDEVFSETGIFSEGM